MGKGKGEKTCACLSEPPAFTTKRLPDVTKKRFCDYKQSFYVYRTDDGDFYQSKSEHRISKNDEDVCVQLLCDKHNTTRFSRVSCESMGHALCTNRVIKGNLTWEAAFKKCVEESTNTSAETLKADIDLSSNPWNVCTSNNISVNQAVWLGIRTIEYDAEYENEEESDIEEATRCQSCKNDCKFENCGEFRLAACEPKLLKRVTDNTNVPVSANYQSKMSNVPTKPQSTPKTKPTRSNVPTKPQSTPKTNPTRSNVPTKPQSTPKTKPTRSNVPTKPQSTPKTNPTRSNVPTKPQSTPKTKPTRSNVPTKPQSTPKTKPTHKKNSLTPSTDSRYRSTTEESNSPRTDPHYTSIATEITEANAFKDLFGNKYTTIIYIISAVLVAIAIVMCSSCIYFRKKRQGKETMGGNADPSNTCHANLVAKTDIYELADNSKMIPLYSVAESINTGKADVGRRILEQEDGVETTEIKLTVRDDIYNHLGEVATSDHQSENIYDHSTQRDVDRDESLYDVTKKETNIQVIPDPTYGHISP
ncbi:uncharacterized protein LOC125670291 isoform X3 [Ostrea edulis]|uniref:uncharacterized protein LOC125670291 isoform X3 n=1 Tax=Ostrea edulis TaxID=37623 RepID=UPI0024AEBF7E|nr:uncharacterized protein LOC125670291 isoform X3 [Ostrea edulis]XP_056018259.1 uncharacterized protein LOC125670291 isoform X3 [Ostrea edulis]